MSNILLIVIGIVIGFIFACGCNALMMWEKYNDHGGNILIDEQSGVYRLILNDNIEDWGDQKYIIMKVSSSETRLKRLNDIDPMSLEDGNESY